MDEDDPTGRRGPSAWMISLCDLTAILLAFFVLLYGMSTIELAKWRKATGTPPESSATNGAPARYTLTTAVRRRGIDLDYLRAVVGQAVAADAELRGVALSTRQDRLVIALPATLFAADAVTPAESGRRLLFALAGKLAAVDNTLTVVGHAAEAEARAAGQDSQWSLSLARAVATVAALQAAGYDRPLPALGGGGGRPGAAALELVVAPSAGTRR